MLQPSYRAAKRSMWLEKMLPVASKAPAGVCPKMLRYKFLGTHPTHGQVFALLCWPTVMTPSRHRRLVLAYDSNPSSDGSVLVSATPPARHHYCPPTPLRPRPHPRWQGFTRAPAQVQQQPEHVLAYTNEYLPMRSGPRAAEGVHCTHSHAGTSAAPQWGKRGIWG